MPIHYRQREPLWRPAAQKGWQLPRDLAPWILDQGSLTARLQAHCQGQFDVQLLNQGWGQARPSELLVLKCPSRQKMLVREVILKGRGENWVFARSLVPYTSLTGRLKALKYLDNKPLGALLFQDPSMRRDPLEAAAICAEHQYLHPDLKLPVAVDLWGRRSVFYIDKNPLLVSEVFLPDFLASL
ncbi:chorismate lyase [Simiduia curdlanivorans]|uniref:Probable chorismate pyruvate-lyase n=1 Tax=Simiduia curdlanivorans TaxID=1492769 RepID=A0ABV8UZX1_9GAMM|nr:chorismate lyase [Simiduia curdlanivorans]MDN3637946.1 chorismate lyase [Simiduia curdlanivorans]